MATADRTRLRWWLVLGPVAVVTAAVAAGALAARGSGEPRRVALLAIDATSQYQFRSLPEMVAASDAVVRGHVVAVERGRLVGDPAGGVISRLVTLRVDDVLAGRAGTSVLLEEEGWLTDGTPIAVNGVAPTEQGDEGVWFLDSVEGGDVPTFVVINSQGRFLDEGGRLSGGDQRDPLVRQLQSLSPADLEASVRGG